MMSLSPTIFRKPTQPLRAFSLSIMGALLLSGSANLPIMANSVIYSAPSENQNGGFTGEIPIKQIGPLSLPKAVVQFKNTDVNVLAVPDWLFDRSVVLSGSLVKAQVDVQGQNSSLRGLIYFIDGLWLNNLSSTNSIDTLDTISGEKLRGRIRSRLDGGFAFKPESGPMRKLLFTEIKTINSPRAYVFTINSSSSKVTPSDFSIEFDANKISFSPTFGRAYASKDSKIPKSTLSGTEPGISNGQIALMVAGNAIMDLAPAIAIPLTLNHHNISQAQQTINLYLSQQQRGQGIPVPLNYSTHGP